MKSLSPLSNFLKNLLKSNEIRYTGFGLAALVGFSICLYGVVMVGNSFNVISDTPASFWSNLGTGFNLITMVASYLSVEISFFRLMFIIWSNLSNVDVGRDYKFGTFLYGAFGTMFFLATYFMSWIIYYTIKDGDFIVDWSGTKECYYILITVGVYFASRVTSMLFLPCFLSCIFHFRQNFCISSSGKTLDKLETF